MRDYLKLLINEKVSRLLSEAENTDPLSPNITPSVPSSVPPADPSLNPDTNNPDQTLMPDTSTPIDNNLGGIPQDPGMGGLGGAPGDDNSQAPTDIEPESDPSKMEGEDSSMPPDEELLNVAKSVSDETQDEQKTLKAVKNIIQTRYDDPIEASDMILKLFNEESPILKSVARRLALYIIGL